MTRPRFRYTDEQWAAISRELSRAGVDADAVLLDAGHPLARINAAPSVRDFLEASARIYWAAMHSTQHKDESAAAQRAVKYSQRLRAEIPKLISLNKSYASDLADMLEEFEGWCEEIIPSLPDEENVYEDDFIRYALQVYVEAIAKVFPDKKPRYKDGGAAGRTVGFLHAALCPVLGKHLTKQALDIRLRRLTKKDPYVRRHRDGESLQKFYEERIAKREEREKEAALKNDYRYKSPDYMWDDD